MSNPILCVCVHACVRVFIRARVSARERRFILDCVLCLWSFKKTSDSQLMTKLIFVSHVVSQFVCLFVANERLFTY